MPVEAPCNEVLRVQHLHWGENERLEVEFIIDRIDVFEACYRASWKVQGAKRKNNRKTRGSHSSSRKSCKDLLYLGMRICNSCFDGLHLLEN